MSASENAKQTLLIIEIPRDELAFRIAQKCIGATAPLGTNATQALDEMDKMGGVLPMGESFRRAADAAVIYVHECLNAGRQPS
ncbi:hypothetical protein [Blastomonas sp.]|jgi:hypothetical protein|uniref:hypothetical protein n=1 Tax=Blastomonas sp. TaxID=1909299 RepID=UPI00406A7290